MRAGMESQKVIPVALNLQNAMGLEADVASDCVAREHEAGRRLDSHTSHRRGAQMQPSFSYSPRQKRMKQAEHGHQSGT